MFVSRFEYQNIYIARNGDLMPKFIPGQVWEYQTREGEEDSRLIVLQVDETKQDGVIVHIKVEGVNIPNPAMPQLPVNVIGFMPIVEASLEESVTKLVSSEESYSPPEDFSEGYKGWKSAFDDGKAGIWTSPVAKVVQNLEDGARS